MLGESNMEDNIVFFPKLKDRIINLGKKALEEKNFSKALLLCNQLKEMNIIIEDTPQGIRWKRG